MKYLLFAICLTLGVSTAIAQEQNNPTKPWTDEYQYGGKSSKTIPLAQDGQTKAAPGNDTDHKLTGQYGNASKKKAPKTNKPSKEGEFEIAPAK